MDILQYFIFDISFDVRSIIEMVRDGYSYPRHSKSLFFLFSILNSEIKIYAFNLYDLSQSQNFFARRLSDAVKNFLCSNDFDCCSSWKPQDDIIVQCINPSHWECCSPKEDLTSDVYTCSKWLGWILLGYGKSGFEFAIRNISN